MTARVTEYTVRVVRRHGASGPGPSFPRAEFSSFHSAVGFRETIIDLLTTLYNVKSEINRKWKTATRRTRKELRGNLLYLEKRIRDLKLFLMQTKHIEHCTNVKKKYKKKYYLTDTTHKAYDIMPLSDVKLPMGLY